MANAARRPPAIAQVRYLLKQGRSVEGMVGRAVARYIRDNNIAQRVSGKHKWTVEVRTCVLPTKNDLHALPLSHLVRGGNTVLTSAVKNTAWEEFALLSPIGLHDEIGGMMQRARAVLRHVHLELRFVAFSSIRSVDLKPRACSK